MRGQFWKIFVRVTAGGHRRLSGSISRWYWQNVRYERLYGWQEVKLMSKQYKLVSCTINGKKVEKMVDVRASLTDMLRDDYRLTSVKKGCEVGECGACNVIIDGECFNSCIYLAVWAEGKEILTLEGLAGPNGELSDIQQAFMDEAAVQCGFCSPGFIMSAVEILEEKKELSDDEIRKKMSGHLCRCTGYENIFRAVKKTMLRRLGKDKEADLV